MKKEQTPNLASRISTGTSLVQSFRTAIQRPTVEPPAKTLEEVIAFRAPINYTMKPVTKFENDSASEATIVLV